MSYLGNRSKIIDVYHVLRYSKHSCSSDYYFFWRERIWFPTTLGTLGHSRDHSPVSLVERYWTMIYYAASKQNSGQKWVIRADQMIRYLPRAARRVAAATRTPFGTHLPPARSTPPPGKDDKKKDNTKSIKDITMLENVFRKVVSHSFNQSLTQYPSPKPLKLFSYRRMFSWWWRQGKRKDSPKFS